MSMLQSYTARPYSYVDDMALSPLDIDFITPSNLDFIVSDGGEMDFIAPDGAGAGMDFIPPSDDEMEFIFDDGPELASGDDIQVQPKLDVNVNPPNIRLGLPKRKRKGAWYEKRPGQTSRKKLPDGVHYDTDTGLYRWIHYDKQGTAHQRLASKPPTPRQLKRSRANFNRSGGLFGSGIGARSRPVDSPPNTQPGQQANKPPEPPSGAQPQPKQPSPGPKPSTPSVIPTPEEPAAESTDGLVGRTIKETMAEGVTRVPISLAREAMNAWQSGNATREETLAKVQGLLWNSDLSPTERQRIEGMISTFGLKRKTDMGVQGSQTTAPSISRPDENYDFNWRVMDLAQVQPSHNPATMEENPNYPFTELQPRKRDGKTAEHQVSGIARNLRPTDVLNETHMLDMGPPIVGPDGAVESGSGRVMGIQRAAAMYPDKYQSYVDALKSPDTLSRVGIDPRQLEGIQQPILVRERATEMDPAQRKAFAREANAPRGMVSSPSESAEQHSDAFKDEQLARLDIPDSATLNEVLLSDANKDIPNSWLGSFEENELAGLADDKGNLNKAGLEAIRNSLFANTYSHVEGGKQLAHELQENVDEDIRRIGTALMNTLPQMARNEALVRSGARKPDYALAEDLAVAVRTLRRLKRSGMPVENYLRSYNAMSDDMTPVRKRLLVFLDKNRNSPREIGNFIRDYTAMVNKDSHSLQGGFGLTGPTPTKEEFVEQRIQMPEGLEDTANQEMSFKPPDMGKRRRQGLA